MLILTFGLWALLTSIWSIDASVSAPRAIYFVYAAAGSISAGYLWSKFFRTKFLGFLLASNIAVILISFFSLLTGIPSDSWTGGCGIGFKGFAGHQNTLGGFIVFTIPVVLYKVFSIINDKLRALKNLNTKNLSLLAFSFYAVLLLLNFAVLLLTESRASIAAVLIILLSFSALVLKWKSLLISGLIIITLASVIYLVSPAVKEIVTSRIFKTERNFGDRRKLNIESAVESAKHGGLIGLGFGISDPAIIHPIIGSFVGDEKRYIREKMITFLALIEEVGIVGMLLFLMPIIYFLWHLVRIVKDKAAGNYEAAFLISVFLGIAFHSQFEWWWLGPGSSQFPLFFAIIGSAVGIFNSVNFSKVKSL